MIIREAVKADMPQLCELFDGYRVFYRKESDIQGAVQFLKERFDEKDTVLFVAENEEKKLMGFVHLFPLFSSTRLKKLWLLNDLFVNAEYRGLGVSIKLINRAKVLVQETSACGMFLETEKSNTIGNNLYPKTGFKLNSDSNYYVWDVE